MWQEFILSHAEKKKPQSSTSEDGLSKKSMTDFHQVISYPFCVVLINSLNHNVLVCLNTKRCRWLSIVKVLDAEGKRFLRVLGNR